MQRTHKLPSGGFLSHLSQHHVAGAKVARVLTLGLHNPNQVQTHIPTQITARHRGRWSPLAPLLKQEWHPGCLALLLDLDSPLRMHRPGFCSGFAPDNHPIKRRQVGSQVDGRSEEHTSELQSLMRISYAVFCLKKKKHQHMPKQN